MTDKEFARFVKEQDFITSDFFESAFAFWFTDNEHIRSPFPLEIQKELKEKSTRFFMEWVYELSPEDRKKESEEELVQMFEMFLFNQGIKLVDNEDQKLTINYPFLPRIGDKVKDVAKGESTIMARELLQRKEKNYLKISLQTDSNKEQWETEFELPA